MTSLLTPTPTQFLAPQPVAIYRHIDLNGELLYVGITTDPVRRWHQHRERSFWARFVADSDAEWLTDRKAARKAERRAIEWERPLFNLARPHGAETLLENQIAYLRTGVSGLFRRPRCKEHGYFHAACGPDVDAWLDWSFATEMRRTK